MKNAQKLGRDWLLIANGTPLSSTKLNELAIDKQVLVLDGAYREVKQSGLAIDVLLGDFDSIHSADLQVARHSIQTIDAPDQNKTDLEKGLEFIDQFQPKQIYICAATGRRIQHSLYNLRILKKYHHPDRPLILLTESEVIQYYQNTNLYLNGQINDCVALLGFPHAIISTSGLKYDVKDFPLSFEKSNSVCNALSAKKAKIEVKGEALIIHEVISEQNVPQIW